MSPSAKGSGGGNLLDNEIQPFKKLNKLEN